MFRFAKLRHDPRTIGNRLFKELAYCPLTFSNSIYAALYETISIEHDFLLFLSPSRVDTGTGDDIQGRSRLRAGRAAPIAIGSTSSPFPGLCPEVLIVCQTARPAASVESELVKGIAIG